MGHVLALGPEKLGLPSRKSPQWFPFQKNDRPPMFVSRSPSALLHLFVGEGSPTKVDKTEKIGYPSSKLSIGGPFVKTV